MSQHSQLATLALPSTISVQNQRFQTVPYYSLSQPHYQRNHPYERPTESPLRNRRNIRLKNYLLLQEAVNSKISFETQSMLLREIEKSNYYLYGNISYHDALMLMLYYMIEYQSLEKLDKTFGFPHSNAKQVFGSLRKSLSKWAKKQIYRGYQNYQER